MDFLNLLCNFYIIILTVVLPLYTEGTYRQIGDTKYLLFRNLSLLCLGLYLMVSTVEAVRGRLHTTETGAQRNRGIHLSGFSVMDVFVLLYGVSVLLSALFSSYTHTPWWGYREWYMGAVSQLLFVGIYFFVSRCYDGKKYSVVLAITAFLAVTVSGILHRLGLDPLGIMIKFNTGDWEYSHMLSTIGNINWFCGYCSVALAFPLAAYLKMENKWLQGILYVVSVAGLFLLFVQGSDIGVLLTMAGLFICLLWGIKNPQIFRRTFLLMAGLCLAIPSYGRLAARMGEEALAAFPADSMGWNALKHPAWWLAGVGCAGIWCLLYWLGNRKWEAIRKYILWGILCILLFVVVGAAFIFGGQPLDDMWGSGRGSLWKVTWQGFLQNDWLHRLVGVGPDCFAEYIYSEFTGKDLLNLDGRWNNAVYANAHNEWLNHLLNLGIMGAGCYLGIFVSGVWRYRRNLMGILVLGLYGLTSLTCFQQCLSTPLLFLVLGLCENSVRRAKSEYECLAQKIT